MKCILSNNGDLDPIDLSGKTTFKAFQNGGRFKF